MPCRWVRGMRREAAKAGVSLDAAVPTAVAACAVIAWWDHWYDDGAVLRAVRRIRRAR